MAATVRREEVVAAIRASIVRSEFWTEVSDGGLCRDNSVGRVHGYSTGTPGVCVAVAGFHYAVAADGVSAVAVHNTDSGNGTVCADVRGTGGGSQLDAGVAVSGWQGMVVYAGNPPTYAGSDSAGGGAGSAAFCEAGGDVARDM